MSIARVLIVDDEPQIRRVLRMTLTDHSYEVADARSGEDALGRLRDERFDLILLDINMPGMGGVAACREIRKTSEAAVIMLTVRNDEADKVAALDAGADDYITKPFGTPELLARMRAALRRTPASPDNGPARTPIGNVVIDWSARTVHRGEVSERLTPKEFDLLRYLLAHPNRAISHRELLQSVWGPDYSDEVEYLRVFIKQLRKKIEANPAKPQHLLTEPWVGYRLHLESPS